MANTKFFQLESSCRTGPCTGPNPNSGGRARGSSRLADAHVASRQAPGNRMDKRERPTSRRRSVIFSPPKGRTNKLEGRKERQRDRERTAKPDQRCMQCLPKDAIVPLCPANQRKLTCQKATDCFDVRPDMVRRPSPPLLAGRCGFRPSALDNALLGGLQTLCCASPRALEAACGINCYSSTMSNGSRTEYRGEAVHGWWLCYGKDVAAVPCDP